MKYELEFIGVNEDTCDADAICLRFFNEKTGKYIIGVYDGGTKKHGEALVKHIKQYYFSADGQSTIDFVVCSHTDQDHASGLSILFDEFRIEYLIMNRPWLYIDDLFDKVNDGRITKESLAKRLEDAYPFVKELEKKAIDNGVMICEGFQGTTISEVLRILSPTKDFFISLLVESNKTPLQDENKNLENMIKRVFTKLKSVWESWTDEMLREDVSTTPENEASIVIFGDMGDESFLLTGDGGLRALEHSIDYASFIGIKTNGIKVHQIPHHGGRHNVSPSLLDSLLGSKVDSDTLPSKMAFVSVGKGTDHPRKMVTNAYKRRGVEVYVAREKVIRHSHNMPNREGWVAAEITPFYDEVEDWD